MADNLTVSKGTILMITTMMGSGVIMIPKAIRNLGYIQGPMILALISSLSFYTLYAISYASYVSLKEDRDSKDEISFYSVTKKYSTFLANLVDLFIAVQGVGSCFVYMKFILKWTELLVGEKCPNKYVLCSIFILPLYATSMLKDLNALRHVGKLSVACVFYLMALCMYYAIKLIGVANEVTGKEDLKPFVYNYGEAIGTILFALGCHQNIVQVFRGLREKSLKNITYISFYCIMAGSLLYLFIGMCGYFVAGNGINISILEFFIKEDKLRDFLRDNSIDKNLYAVKAGMIAFLCVMFCAFPMQMHPARDSFTNLVGLMVDVPKKRTKDVVTTFFCVLVYVLGMFASDNYGLIIDIIGATATNGITYFVPALVYWLCVGKSKTPLGMLGAVVGGASVLLMVYLLYVAIVPSKA